MTPIQEAIKFIPNCFGENNSITQSNIVAFLTPFLKLEEPFARQIFEAGCDSKQCIVDKTPDNRPFATEKWLTDFETYYKKIKQ